MPPHTSSPDGVRVPSPQGQGSAVRCEPAALQVHQPIIATEAPSRLTPQTILRTEDHVLRSEDRHPVLRGEDGGLKRGLAPDAPPTTKIRKTILKTPTPSSLTQKTTFRSEGAAGSVRTSEDLCYWREQNVLKSEASASCVHQSVLKSRDSSSQSALRSQSEPQGPRGLASCKPKTSESQQHLHSQRTVIPSQQQQTAFETQDKIKTEPPDSPESKIGVTLAKESASKTDKPAEKGTNSTDHSTVRNGDTLKHKPSNRTDGETAHPPNKRRKVCHKMDTDVVLNNPFCITNLFANVQNFLAQAAASGLVKKKKATKTKADAPTSASPSTGAGPRAQSPAKIIFAGPNNPANLPAGQYKVVPQVTSPEPRALQTTILTSPSPPSKQKLSVRELLNHQRGQTGTGNATTLTAAAGAPIKLPVIDLTDDDDANKAKAGAGRGRRQNPVANPPVSSPHLGVNPGVVNLPAGLAPGQAVLAPQTLVNQPGLRPGQTLLLQAPTSGNGTVVLQPVNQSTAIRAQGTTFLYTAPTSTANVVMQTPAVPGASTVLTTVSTPQSTQVRQPASTAAPATRKNTITTSKQNKPAAASQATNRPPILKPGASTPTKSSPAIQPKAQNTSPGGVEITSVQAAKHPAPLPSAPPQQSGPNMKGLPPKPGLKISRVQQGIVLSWNMTLSDSHDKIKLYHLFAYQEGTAAPNSWLWKKVGDITALPLPMACTLTQFQEGNKYHFAVRAVDTHGRLGPFSDPNTIHLTARK